MKQQDDINNSRTSKINSEEPLVSIIVITYNSAKYILETLESIKAQTYRNIELIISDDCSYDCTLKICQEWITENKKRFSNTELITSRQNSGISSNCNRGVKSANGVWVKLIAGDDTLQTNSISKYIEFSRQFHDALVFHANASFYINTFSEMNLANMKDLCNYRFNKEGISASEQYKILLRQNPVISGSVFLKRSIFDKVGYFNEAYRNWEDRPMWLKLTSNDIKMHYINEKLFNYRLSKGSITNNLNISDRPFSPFDMMRDKILLTDFKEGYSRIELIIRKLELRARIMLQFIGINRSGKLGRFLVYLFRKPFTFIIGRYNRKYIID